MRKYLVPLLILALSGCATRKPPADANRPEVRITQISGVPLAARYSLGGMSVRYRVRVYNNAKERITLERVAIDSIGMGAYAVSHFASFNLAIEPARSNEIDFWAATQRTENVSGANGPVTLRVVASFQTPSRRRFQDVTVQNVNAMGLPR